MICQNSVETIPNPRAAGAMALMEVTPVQMVPVAEVRVARGTLAAPTPNELPSVVAAAAPVIAGTI